MCRNWERISRHGGTRRRWSVRSWSTEFDHVLLTRFLSNPRSYTPAELEQMATTLQVMLGRLRLRRSETEAMEKESFEREAEVFAYGKRESYDEFVERMFRD